MHCAVPEAGVATPHASENACADAANRELPECRSTHGGGLQCMSFLIRGDYSPAAKTLRATCA
jgi:hypothetical protein